MATPQVLDVARPDAYAYLLGRSTRCSPSTPDRYLKWDHNRDLTEAGHHGRPGVHRQTLAVYRLLDELRARHPGVEIESCASGGARVDLEILRRTDRVWASDCNDALERLSIQRWTGLLLPPELIGTPHGRNARNHHPVHDLGFRRRTALFGHHGIEWDIGSITSSSAANWPPGGAAQAAAPAAAAARVVRGRPPDPASGRTA